MKLTLTINLGNDAMKSSDHVADALKDVADKVRYFHMAEHQCGMFILDINGSRVGEFKVEE